MGFNSLTDKDEEIIMRVWASPVFKLSLQMPYKTIVGGIEHKTNFFY